jgi:Family of unknown function (DUF6411)
MLIAGIIAFCVLLFFVALLFPRLSRKLERGGDAPLGAGQHAASHAPGKLGRWLQKPFGTSRKAVHKSGSAGRRSRFKLPF